MDRLTAAISAQRDGVPVNVTVPVGLDDNEKARAADRLLTASLAVLGREEYPFYSEAYLRNREARDRQEASGSE